MENDPQLRNQSKNMSHIKGWGIDANPHNDPTYPMRERGQDDHGGYDWDRPEQQPHNDIEVLHSNERPNLTSVFGTAAPPKGLSGLMRRSAFHFGEGSYGHWFLLLLADRINWVEGIADDLWHGRVPNTCAERGMKAQWKYDRKSVIKKAVVTTAVVTGALYWLSKRKE